MVFVLAETARRKKEKKFPRRLSMARIILLGREIVSQTSIEAETRPRSDLYRELSRILRNKNKQAEECERRDCESL